MINTSTRDYGSLDHDSSSFLCWVMTPGGKIPVLSYLCALGSILLPSDADGDFVNKQAVKLLKRLYENAESSVNRGDWNSCTSAQRARWVVEMAAAIPRAMIYEPDAVRTGQGPIMNTSPADQWVHLLNFPEPNKAGFDCEDAAICALEMIYLMKHLDLSTECKLQQVQEFIKPYSACFLFGNIRIGCNTCAHAYAALIDSNYIDDPSQSNRNPTIVIEGTARVGGYWHDEGDEAMKQSFSIHQKVNQALGHGQGFSRVIRDEAHMKLISENDFYGNVHAVIVPDHKGTGKGMHLLVHYEGSDKIGATPQDLFSSEASIRFKSILETTLEASLTMCMDLPRSYIPYCIDGDSKQDPQGEFHVDIHWDTFQVKKQKVIELIGAKLGNKWKITVQQAILTDQLSVARMWFSRD